MLRRKALDSYILDPDFRLFMIDVDLCKRIYDRGYKIYIMPEAKAVHLKTASASKRGKVWLEREFYRGLILYFKKHYPFSLPLVWALSIADRLARIFLARVVGHEPVR
jgi:GT2 family glycosyltransferase